LWTFTACFHPSPPSPPADIDDYVFEPCGYSMNGVEGGTFSTVHITPEEGFSYASFEICGYAPGDVNAGG
jgi:S-adenosylmethionine decarboxylase